MESNGKESSQIVRLKNRDLNLEIPSRGNRGNRISRTLATQGAYVISRVNLIFVYLLQDDPTTLLELQYVDPRIQRRNELTTEITKRRLWNE